MGKKQKRGKSKKQSKISKTKNHYLQLYKSYGAVYCPALEADVLFTDWGWQHLFMGKWRTSIETEERLRLLPLAKKLIEVSHTIYRKRFQDYHDHYEFKALLDGVRLSVLVIENKKKYYFYSVFRE